MPTHDILATIRILANVRRRMTLQAVVRDYPVRLMMFSQTIFASNLRRQQSVELVLVRYERADGLVNLEGASNHHLDTDDDSEPSCSLQNALQYNTIPVYRIPGMGRRESLVSIQNSCW